MLWMHQVRRGWWHDAGWWWMHAWRRGRRWLLVLLCGGWCLALARGTGSGLTLCDGVILETEDGLEGALWLGRRGRVREGRV